MSSDSNKKGKLFILSGPSGAGKGTICKELLQRAEPDSLCLSVSMTTREPRNGEEEGVHYFFVDEETFTSEIDNGGLLEYAEVYGNHYGTPKAKVLEKLNKGIDVLLEIEMQGALKVKKNYEDGVFIFILPPSMAELRKRITGRGTETRDVIDFRMSKALGEISYIDKYDYVVVNDDLDEAVSRVQAIIKAEHSKVTKDIYSLIEEYKEDN
jgi:guanylate kinase